MGMALSCSRMTCVHQRPRFGYPCAAPLCRLRPLVLALVLVPDSCLVLTCGRWCRQGNPAPLSSDALLEKTGEIYNFMIDSFGPERCMFES